MKLIPWRLLFILVFLFWAIGVFAISIFWMLTLIQWPITGWSIDPR